MIRFSSQTHPGLRRDHNEDAVLAEPDCGLFVVADGVGGRAAGEIASALTIQTFAAASDELAETVQSYTADPQWSTRNAVLEVLDQVCQRASRKVFDEAEASGKKGMTTTIVAAVVGGGAAFLAHAGDSRAYLIRDGLIRQLTEDHSMINELVRTGQMTYEEASRSRYRSVITRAVGLYPTVQTDLMSIEILPGDRILLNTDGLSDLVQSESIEDIASQDDVQTANDRLLQAALDAGGTDNITVVIVEPEATPQTEAARARAQVMNELFLFQSLPFHARLRVSRICQEVFFTPDQVLVEEGSIGDAMYVIVQGEVKITREGVELARLGAREHFGELGLLEDQERSATVVGAAYGSAIMIGRHHLQEFCQREPGLGNDILWRLVKTLGKRLVVANHLAAKNAPRS
jgi:serine/threonine protein phosphatase PrpC